MKSNLLNIYRMMGHKRKKDDLPQWFKDSIVCWYDPSKDGTTNEKIKEETATKGYYTGKDLSGNGRDIEWHGFDGTETSGYRESDGALVLRGKEYGQSLSQPKLTDYTWLFRGGIMSSTRTIIKKSKNVGNVADGAFSIYITPNYQYFVYSFFKSNWHDFKDVILSNDILYQTRESFNGEKIPFGTIEDSTNLYLGIQSNMFTQQFLLFDRTLTPSEIDWVKENVMWDISQKYIKFEDPEVERICVQNWSSDGKGVTYEDAANVTDLSTAFRQNKVIKRFNELQYFIGLHQITGFVGCSSLVSVTLPPVNIIGNYAFTGCTSLTDIELSENIREIGQDAFSQTKISGSLYLPNLNKGHVRLFGQTLITEVKSLGNINILYQAIFYGCEALKKVILSPKIESIQQDAIAGTGIEVLIVENPNPPTVDMRFNRIPNATIYVPDESVDLYKNDLPYGWGFFANNIKPLSEYVEQ